MITLCPPRFLLSPLAGRSRHVSHYPVETSLSSRPTLPSAPLTPSGRLPQVIYRPVVIYYSTRASPSQHPPCVAAKTGGDAAGDGGGSSSRSADRAGLPVLLLSDGRTDLTTRNPAAKRTDYFALPVEAPRNKPNRSID